MSDLAAGGSVLIVDDSPDNVELLGKIFTSAGFAVFSAGDGVSALSAVRGWTPDLVILDIIMPGMDGREVLRRLKSDEAARDIPVIVISGIGASVEKAATLSDGAADFITKPFLAAEVLARANHHLELKRTREALGRSHLLLRSVLDAIPTRVFWKDMESRYLGCNRAFATDIGVDSPECVEGRDDAELISRGAHPSKLAAVGFPPGGADVVRLGVEREVDMEGARASLLLNTVPLRGSGGEVIGRLTTYEEVSERRKLEEVASHREALLKEAGELARVGGWEFDPASGAWSWTEEVARIHDMEADETERLPLCLDLYSASARRTLERGLDRALSLGEPYDLVLDFVSARGIHKTVHTICHPLVRGGRVVRVIGAVQDISERVRADAQMKTLVAEFHQAQKMEALGTLAGGIAHDFNNILGAIIGYSQLSIAQVEAGSDIHENLSETLEAARRARDLVKRILAFSRRNSDHPQTIEVAPPMKEAVKLLRSTVPTSIEISFESSSREPLAVLATPTQIHQIILNLGTNAFQALSLRGGRIGFFLDAVAVDSNLGKRLGVAPEEYVCLTVTDNGPGIAPDHLAKVFDPFFTTKPVGEGTGLGLSVVLGIARANGGAVEVGSTLGVSTTFRVFLPRAAMGKAASRGKPPKVFGSSPGRALVVDDEEALAKLLAKLLTGIGLKVDRRSDPIEALELLMGGGRVYDVIVTDMTMPGLSGLEFFARMRKAGVETPVIICTGHSEMITSEGALEAGFAAFLRKPVEKEELLEAVSEALAKRRG